MSILCLTGWQQPTDALANIAPDAMHFDYAAYDNLEAMFAALPKTPSLAIGWSLGGQLLARAIAAGYTKPKTLILLGAPFQWVADAHFAEGFPQAAVKDVVANYHSDKEAMLRNLNALIALGDVHEKRIVRTLNATARAWMHGMFWLDELRQASCRMLDFVSFPTTVIVHGTKDKVIYPVNAYAFAERVPQTQLLLWSDCAHAPHLHDTQALRMIVREHV